MWNVSVYTRFFLALACREKLHTFPFLVLSNFLYSFSLLVYFQAVKDVSYLKKLAWFCSSFKIVSFRVRNKIFRPGFLGPVVKFTHVSHDDIIKASTSDVIVARLKTFMGRWYLYRFKYVSSKHLAKYRVFSIVTMLRNDFVNHVTQRKG